MLPGPYEVRGIDEFLLNGFAQVREDGLEGGEVAVNVGDDGDAHEDSFPSASEKIKRVGVDAGLPAGWRTLREPVCARDSGEESGA